MTLLSIVQNVADDIGLPRPSMVAASVDQDARSFMAHAKKAVADLAKTKNGGWTILQRLHTFTTVASQDEYDLPSDFREPIGDTAWDRSTYFEMRGPLSAQEWQAVRSGLAASPALRFRWRIKRAGSGVTNKFVLDPVPTASGDTLVFEYVSSHPILDADGSTTKTTWAADDDTSLLDEDLIELGLKYRFQESRGLEFRVSLADYERQLDMAMARDGGARVLALAHRGFRLPPANVPETGFGS